MLRAWHASDGWVWRLLPLPTGFADLSDDLVARVLSLLDCTQLRICAGVCRRFAELCSTRMELWRSVDFQLPPKRSRGRDRRNSYTTPCALNLERLAAWLQRRRQAILRLEVALLYPDAAALLPQLLPPLEALQALVLHGHCSDWPYLWLDWRWLAGMRQLESLTLNDSLPGLAELLLPPSLTELRIDRVGEGDPDTEGWDELPACCFSQLIRLQRLTLGTGVPYLLGGAEEEGAWEPLRACKQLVELRLPNGALSAVPDVLTALTGITALSFRGCDRLEAFGELCAHKSDPFAPLAALKQLRSLDYSRCALEQLPPWLGTLPHLTQLLLADNQLTSLPTCWGSPEGSAGTPAGAVAAGAAAAASVGAVSVAPLPAAGGQRGPAAGAARAAAGAAGAAVPPVALPPGLRHLELQGNPFAALPAALLAPEAAQLTHLDLSRCYKLNLTPADWRQLLRTLPRLHVLRHSCQLLTAEVRGHGGAAQLAAALGACQQLRIEQHPPKPAPRPPDPRTVQLFEEMLQQAARQHVAQALAAAGGSSGGSGGRAGAAAEPAGPSSCTAAASGRLSRSYGSFDQLEQGAAAALLGGGGGAGSSDGSASDDDGTADMA
ncbi:disease resistance TAO1-like isoform X1 [Chlorella sorokiniana]|uniref:Disease resistance TAO1-like isoform X1 n=1 Tax=Chlorella sorokiniana TaxID=3076 RepID=A0A2P6TJ55_CHLSO|nr:disease resistance TAO1-like isoform X1 [Chlorella sorokiniana]|eukprot:PRW39242.1 disease resistance TAO1-like isoform X1 [Chlorella sorokiniana]